jgi:organic radical activating enzyme
MFICRDLTIVIPVKIDSNDRLDNIKTVLTFLNRNFDTRVIIGENSKKSLLKNLDFKYSYMFIEDKNDVFHKTKTLNTLYKESTTPFIAAWDSDVLVDVENINRSMSELRSHRLDFIYPFNNKLCDIPRSYIDKLLDNPTTNIIDIKKCKYRDISLVTGCLFMFNKSKMIEFGMENEKFIGWGGEDDERYDRIVKLGGKMQYLKNCGPVYHIKHFRGIDSRPKEGKLYSQDNREELVKTRKMPKDELKKYIKNDRNTSGVNSEVITNNTSDVNSIKSKVTTNNSDSISIIVRKNILTSLSINALYKRLKSETGFKFKLFCITDSPDDLNDEICVISDSLIPNNINSKFKDLFLLSNKYRDFSDNCFYISENINDLSVINTTSNMITDGKTFFKFSPYSFSYLYEGFNNSNLYSNIFEYVKNNYKDISFKNLEDFNNIQLMKDKLNKVGCGFCLAKWEQVTLHLHNGTTHSCYHPLVHKVPLEELKDNPSAICNTLFKKKQRKDMLEGKRVSECSFCWNIEDNSKTYSDRHYKSAVLFSESFNKIKNSNWMDNYNPSYVEVSFSNDCNLACSYCSPMTSSRFMKEVEKYGGYYIISNGSKWLHHDISTKLDMIPYKKGEYNPYIDAFWKWFPDLYKSLKNFRITGGEPLINKDTYKVLDYVLENPKQDLELSINSNMSVPNIYFKRFIEYLNKMKKSVMYNNFILYTSCESYGNRAEYIRFGLDFKKFVNNVEYILSNYSIKVSFMSTYNILSISSFDVFIEMIIKWKTKYGKDRIYIDIPYLELPSFMSPMIVDIDYLKINLKKQLLLMKNSKCFSKSELNRMTQILEYSDRYKNTITNEELIDLRRSFCRYFTEYDIRKHTNFLETFPEYEQLWNDWKKYE